MTISPVVTTISPNMFRCCATCGHGKSDFKGDFFTMNDCWIIRNPSVHESDMRRAKRRWHGVLRPSMPIYNFWQRRECAHGFAPTAARGWNRPQSEPGRDVGSYVLFMVIAMRPTMPLAPNGNTTKRARWRGVSWLTEQSQKDTRLPVLIPTSVGWPIPLRR